MRMTARQKSRARVLRRWAPEPAVVLWQELRARRLEGAKFRRNAPVGPHIVEFVCLELRLVVEVTGKGQHRTILAQRDQSLQQAGFGVLRVMPEQVLGDLEGVLRRIRAAVRARQIR